MSESYGFTYTDIDGKEYNLQVQNSPSCQWSGILQDFVQFLSHVYGYDIQPHVRISMPPYLQGLDAFELEDMTSWRGEFFDRDEDEEDEDANPGDS